MCLIIETMQQLLAIILYLIWLDQKRSSNELLEFKNKSMNAMEVIILLYVSVSSQHCIY